MTLPTPRSLMSSAEFWVLGLGVEQSTVLMANSLQWPSPSLIPSESVHASITFWSWFTLGQANLFSWKRCEVKAKRKRERPEAKMHGHRCWVRTRTAGLLGHLVDSKGWPLWLLLGLKCRASLLPQHNLTRPDRCDHHCHRGAGFMEPGSWPACVFMHVGLKYIYVQIWILLPPWQWLHIRITRGFLKFQS